MTCDVTGVGGGGEQRQRQRGRLVRIGNRLVSATSFPLLLVEPDTLKCPLTSYKHSTSVQQPSPQKLSLLDSCVIAGAQPKGARC